MKIRNWHLKKALYRLKLLSEFFIAIANDPRINTTHISLYMRLLKIWKESSFKNPLSVFSHEIMPLCKISGCATYHKSIRQLHEYGYIKYAPSFNHFARSQIYLSVFLKIESLNKINKSPFQVFCFLNNT